MADTIGTRDGDRSEPRPGGPALRYDLPSGGRLLLGWALVLVGVVLLIVGWYGVSGHPQVASQISYVVSGGLGGLLAGIVGVGLLVSNDVRKDRERLGRVEAAMLEIRDMLVAQAEEAKRLNAGPAGNAERPVRVRRPAQSDRD